MFGQQRPAFGGTASTFGTGFGATNPTTTGFGASSFGKSTFGSPQQTTSFGTASTPFGSATSSGTSLFGTQQQPAAGGLFGQQQTQQTSTGFNQPSTGFGSTSGGSLFGQTQQPQGTAGLFSSGGTGFGTQQSTQNRPFGFGQTTTSTSTGAGGLFSSSQPNTGGSLFNNPTGFGAAGGAAVSGTTVKYEPVTGTDTMTRNGVSSNIRTRIEVITAMKQYETKSLEELRVEDYLANRKGPGQGATMGGFGQAQQQQPQQQSTGLFGSSSGNSLFGTSKPPENKSLFGTGTSTGFGTTSGGSLFGSSATSTGFGQTSTAPATSFSFSQNTQNKTGGGFSFGFPPTSTPSLFGSQPQQQQPQQQQQQQQPSFGFGGGGFQLNQNQQQQQQQNTGGLFGNQQKPGFFNNNTGTGLFGSKPAGTTQPLTTGFGTTSTASPFGTTPTSTGGSLFGTANTQNKPGMFTGFGAGNTNTFGNTGLFGQNNNQQKPGNLTFGTATNFTPGLGQTLGTNTGLGLFNTTNTNSTGLGLGGGGLLNNNAGFGMMQNNSMGGLGAGGAFPEVGKLVKALTEKPFLSLTKDKPPAESGSSPGDSGGAKLTSSGLKPTYVLSPSLLVNNKVKPKPINKNNNQGDRHWLFKGLDDPNEDSSEDFLKPKKYPSVRKLNLRVFKGGKNDSTMGSPGMSGEASLPLTNPVSPAEDASPVKPAGLPQDPASPTPDIIKGRERIKSLNLRNKPAMNDTLADLNVVQVSGGEDHEDPGQDPAEEDRADDSMAANKENISLFDVSTSEDACVVNKSSDKPHPAGIKLHRSGYYTLPGLDELGDMVDSSGSCLVENFTVGRYGYGNVCFLGVTDVAGLDLDAVVFILRKQIEVYPEGTEKPAEGHELNKPAIITLDCVWPVDKTSREVIKSVERLDAMGWSEYLERQCLKMESSFIEYRPETGSWVFKVKHFSKYGLQDDDNEEDMSGAPPAKPPQPAAAPLRSQLPPLASRPSGPPAMALTSPPQFSLSHMAVASLPTKPGVQHLLGDMNESGLQDSQAYDEDLMDSCIAKEAEESAAMSVLSPSSERLTTVSRVAARTVQLAKWQMFGGEEEDDAKVPTRGSTPTPQLAKGSFKKLILGGDSSLNASGQYSLSSPVASEPAAFKPKTIIQPQPITITTPPKANVQSESCPSPELRDPRSEYLLLQSGGDMGRELGHVPPQHQTALVPLHASLLANKDHLLSDMGAFMGRSFRVGWGPGWHLIHAGPQLASAVSEEEREEEEEQQSVVDKVAAFRSPASFLFMGSAAPRPRAATATDAPRYKLTVEKLHAVRQNPTTLLEASLECVLANSVLTCDEISDADDPSCPHFKPVADVELLHHLADTAAAFVHEDPTLASIFDLCVALWGRLDFFSPESDGDSDYVASRARVEAISLWLEGVCSSAVQQDVAAALSPDNAEEGYLDAVFAHLTARQVSQACTLAQDKGDHHLALLLSQTCFGQVAPREILAQQLANWAEGGTDALMAPSRLALYCLLAAAPTHQASHTTVNTCQGLDWKRAFGLHLWYVCPATSTVAEALQEYEQAAGLKGNSPPYCEVPLPPYLATHTLPDQLKVSYDVCYHLLKLFTDPMHQLETVLNPATITPDPVDVTVSWLLWRVLESLGYHHLSDHLSASLHLSMAALLEAAGHWHWAAFVLLNMQHEDRRSSEVQKLLLRHVAVGGDDDPKYSMRESFVVDRLRVPEKWLHQAKATKARALNMVDEEAWYLLKAGDYNRAHVLVVDTIAPNAIINEDHGYLQGYLDQFSDDGVRGCVVDWAIGGGVYADYLDLVGVVDDMKKSADPTPAKLEQLRPRLLALCSRLNNLRCNTATHRLCVSEMSRVVVGVLRAVVGEGTDATQVLSQQLSGLPLTHDYALAELNLVTTHYLTHLAQETS